jgi:hypothetical protein
MMPRMSLSRNRSLAAGNIINALVEAGRSLGRQCAVSARTLMSEEAEACFVLPLREAVAHFALRNTKSADTEVGIALTMAMLIRGASTYIRRLGSRVG